MILNEIPAIALALKNAKTDKIKLFHSLLFNTEGDRQNRSRIRTFSGFTFVKNSSDFKSKVDEIAQKFSLLELISVANILHIEINGTETELSERILSYLCDLESLQKYLQRSANSESDFEEIPSTSSKVQSDRSNVMVPNNIMNEVNVNSENFKSNIHFHDIEHIIPKFSGKKHENVQLWLEKFESFCYSFDIKYVQKFLFAERALSGIAALFIKSESNIHNFTDFKNALLSEFGSHINSAEIHEILRHRRIREKESLLEYFFIMKELSSRANVDDNALMHYVINGIDDSPQNKSILYDCTNLTDFKNKLKVYEEIRKDTKFDYGKRKGSSEYVKPQYSHVNKFHARYDSAEKYKTKYDHNDGSINHSTFSSNRNVKVCFNCGSKDHISKFCTDKNKGFKCFKCNCYGHKAYENKCSIQSDDHSKQVNSLNSQTNSLSEMHKLVKFSGVLINALIDTGSSVTLLREDVYAQMQLPKLESVGLSLTGFGSGNTQPLGSFQGNIEIDQNVFFTTVYVINKAQMHLPLIIGTDIITQGSLLYDKNGLTLTKSESENSFVFLVNAVVDPLEVELSHISDKFYQAEIRNLIHNYKPVKTQSTDLKMSIVLKDDIPIVQRPRRMSLAEKTIVSDQIEQWLKEGIIKPSCSDYASPVVLVKKKDDSMRLCVDYRKLNKKIIKDNYPLPLIDDILDQLHNAQVFTSLDLKNGFFHVDIDPNSTKYTAFVTHNGQWEFLKAPFGLCTSPAAFNRYLACVFRRLLADGTLILYMDDFIIPAKTEEEGLFKLKQVLQVASNYGLHINFKKSQFLTRTVEFLGHIIHNNTISPSPLKVKAVQNFPEPTNLKHLQSFLGLAGYFRKYIPGYAAIAKPLSDLLRNSSTFYFGPEQRTAFSSLKTLLSKEPVLQLFIPGSELEVHTDASKFGFGAVLLQKSNDNKLHPILYMSKKTSPQEEKLHSYELEVLAIIEALKKFRVYLHGTKFKIVTDCEAFQKTMDKAELSAKIARWALFLQDFNYIIVHRSAQQMRHVDALSRYPVMLITHNEITTKIIKSQSTDDFINDMKQKLEHSPMTDFFLKNGVLYKIVEGHELLVVPQAMQHQIVHDAHSKGHFSTQTTANLIKRDYYIPNLTELVQTVIKNCVPCILSSRKSGKSEGYLHPIPKGDTPLDTYHVDFLGPLPSTNKNYKYLFTVVDAFTKFLWIYPVKSTSARDAIDKLKLQQTVFGNPRRIISDQGSGFTSTDFKTFCENECIEHIKITTGVPRGNGQIERLHGTLIPVLTKLSLDDSTKWYKHVAAVQKIINSTTSTTTKFSPFELLVGIKMRNSEDTQIKQILEYEYLKSTLDHKNEMRQIAKSNILHHQKQSKRYYDRQRKPAKIYKIGDLVAIQRTQFGSGLKLKIKYFGPYQVTAVKGHDRYVVAKVGQHEGPNITSTAADIMKPWSTL